MPQTLLVSSSPQGSTSKRQRSADGRQTRSRANSLEQSGFDMMQSATVRSPAKPNVRLPKYLEKSKAEISATFQEIEWKQRFRLFHAMDNPETSPYKVDRSDIVISRNRYGNVQPWDALRIKLRTPIAGSDYVNASPIVLKSRGKADTTSNHAQSDDEVRYIATQGPKVGQISHFWHMVHQELHDGTGVIIMLTQLVEDNKEKCAKYFPIDLDDPTITLVHEDDGSGRASSSETNNAQFSSHDPVEGLPDTVTLISKDYDNTVNSEVRKMKLTINGVAKNIVHYLFGRWPDFGKPDKDDRKALVEMSKRSFKEAGGNPRIVHCSAGVGRTGTWIALDFLVREVEEERLLDSAMAPSSSSDPVQQDSNGNTPQETWGKSGPLKVNTPVQEDGFEKDEHDLIFETVNALREQRMMMVIREIQFSFLYDVVKEALFEKYRARPEGAVVRTEGGLAESQPRSTKLRRISDEADADDAPESNSEAETEIMDTDAQPAPNDDDDDDPYSAVSPDIVRKGMIGE